MMKSYAFKQKNPGFVQLSLEQALTDLHLFKNGKLNYAALILLAKKEVIQEKLPQSRIIWGIRNEEAQNFQDARIVIEEQIIIIMTLYWHLITHNSLYR